MPNFDLLLGSERAAWLADRAKARGSSVAVELRRLIDERAGSVTEGNNPIGFAPELEERGTIGGNLKEGGKERSATSPQLRGLLLPEMSSLAETRAQLVGDKSAERRGPRYGTNLVPSPAEDGSLPEFPAELRTDRFSEAWKSWIEYRREARLVKWKPVTIRAKLKELSQMGHDMACEAIRSSIANGWQGIFVPKESRHKLPTMRLARHLLVTSDYRQAERAVAELALPPEEHVAWLDKIRAAKDSEELGRIVTQATTTTEAR